MREVSVGGAIAAGFRLIAREPVAFLVWAALYGVVGIVPQMFGWMASFNALSAMSAGAVAPAAAMAEAMAPMQRLQPVTLLTASLSAMLLYGAGFRAVLYPDERRYFYLRIGARELWMALSTIALFVIYILAVLATMIPFAILIFGAGAAGGGAGAAVGLLVGVPLVFVAMGVVLWGFSRLSVALPMSFAQRNFRIPEAWTMTKGHAGRIFLVMLALIALVLLAEMLAFALGAGVISLFMPLADLGKLFTQNPAKLFATVNPGVWAVIAVVWALFGTAAGTLFAAALAQIYRDLIGPAHAEVFS